MKSFLGIRVLTLLCSGIALLSLTRITFAQSTPDPLKTALRRIQEDAKQISAATSSQQKAKTWIALNRDAVKFSAKMNRSFPHSRIQGDRTEPQAAETLAEQATAFGVRIYFCEPDGAWAASNEGYFKYLELWPTGPAADVASWMGPAGNQSGCGDFEGSPDELRDLVTKNRSFLAHFPHSRFAAEAKRRLVYAESALSSSRNSQQK
jgi:hypothetical protein